MKFDVASPCTSRVDSSIRVLLPPYRTSPEVRTLVVLIVHRCCPTSYNNIKAATDVNLQHRVLPLSPNNPGNLFHREPSSVVGVDRDSIITDGLRNHRDENDGCTDEAEEHIDRLHDLCREDPLSRQGIGKRRKVGKVSPIDCSGLSTL